LKKLVRTRLIENVSVRSLRTGRDRLGIPLFSIEPNCPKEKQHHKDEAAKRVEDSKNSHKSNSLSADVLKQHGRSNAKRCQYANAQEGCGNSKCKVAQSVASVADVATHKNAADAYHTACRKDEQ
jgi:hypothetical protein